MPAIVPTESHDGCAHYQTMKTLLTLSGFLAVCLHAACCSEPLYQNNFESVAVGSEPEGFLVIDGQFAVREFEGGKVFELPGSPLESYGFLFGPNFSFNDAGTKFKIGAKPEESLELGGASVSARAQSLKKGRRFPTFSVGLCGVSGYKLRVAPMKRAIELVRGDNTVASRDFDWSSGAWTKLKLQVRVMDGKWIAEGKVWNESDAEPSDWQLRHETTEKPNPGKASAWAAPFSGEPIRFDDLVVKAVDP